MAKNKKENKTFMLRVLMSEREHSELEKLCGMAKVGMSELVRRAIQSYDPVVRKEYAKRVQAQRSAERATQGSTGVVNNLAVTATPTLEQLRARIGVHNE